MSTISYSHPDESDPSVLKLDLETQRLLINPDDRLPRFYPRPKAVMVIPIYDDIDFDHPMYAYPTRVDPHSGRLEGGHGPHSHSRPPAKSAPHSFQQAPSSHRPSPLDPSQHQRPPAKSAPHSFLQANSSHRPSHLDLSQSTVNQETPEYSPGRTPKNDILQTLKNRHEAFHAAIREYLRILPANPHWCASHCTGRKKAVCIGINYIGQRKALKGCANDARRMRDFLINQYKFPPSSVILLTDDDRKNRLPTREEMFRAFSWLVEGAKKDDSLFFHYSGHGSQVKDETGRELDGMDEDIFPVDHEQAGDIIDDDLYKALVKPLPPGCRLTALFDSCHSGTVLDLPYVHSAHGRLRSISHISKRARQRGMAPAADVICFSACKDDETAADTFNDNGSVAVGAMSYAFTESLENNHDQTYDELLAHLREILVPRYEQKPQISCTIPLELERKFTL